MAWCCAIAASTRTMVCRPKKARSCRAPSGWLTTTHCRRFDDAERLFESLLNLRNDLGLLSEEYDPQVKRQLGNFPQAFSHITLVNTAFNLCQRVGPAEDRRAEGATAGAQTSPSHYEKQTAKAPEKEKDSKPGDSASGEKK